MNISRSLTLLLLVLSFATLTGCHSVQRGIYKVASGGGDYDAQIKRQNELFYGRDYDRNHERRNSNNRQD